MRKDLEGHDVQSFNAMECNGRILVEVSVCVDLVEFGALRSVDHMCDTQRLQHLEILCCRAAMIYIYYIRVLCSAAVNPGRQTNRNKQGHRHIYISGFYAVQQ